jgi:23S rRNA pseudouridine1911/1915/1917 synthase
VKAILDQGRVLLNGRRVVIASWQVRPGDRVDIVSEGDEAQPAAGEHYLKIVHEDADLLVIEKDAGIACEKSPVATRPSIVSIINAYLKRKYPHRKGHYLGLVHRLDRDTSGLMVYTKTHEANRITDQFKRHAIKRRYLAVVEGKIEGPSGKIEGYLKKSALLSGGRKVTSSTPESGHQAVTLFKVLERYDNATLVEVTLNTGRTHQIRVQMASIGHPVVGDKIYGGERVFPFHRQALHATFLKFHHPVTGKNMEFRSDLPRDMRRLVDRLRTDS